MGSNALQELKSRAAELRVNAEAETREMKDQTEQMANELPSTREMQEQALGRATTVLQAAEKAPDTAYLGAMAASMALSLLLLGRKNKAMALFVGLWPVTILNLAMVLKNRRPSREVLETTPVSAGADGPLLAE